MGVDFFENGKTPIFEKKNKLPVLKKQTPFLKKQTPSFENKLPVSRKQTLICGGQTLNYKFFPFGASVKKLSLQANI